MGLYLSQIAAGRLLAEAVVMFAGEPATLRRVAALPPAEQRRVVAGAAPVPGAKPAAGGRPAAATPRAYDPARGRGPAGPAHSPAAAAAVASPGDVAETVLDMVRASKDPRAVAARLLPELERIAGRKAVNQ
jgi:hypothetical protein